LPETRFANNCHISFLSTKTPVITEIDIKYRCNTVHAVNFSRELVLENATSGSLKVLEVLEFQYQNIVGTLFEAYMGYVDRSTGWLALYSVVCRPTADTKKYECSSLSCKFSFLSCQLKSML